MVAETPAIQIAETGKTAVDAMEDVIDIKMGFLTAPETAQGKPF